MNIEPGRHPVECPFENNREVTGGNSFENLRVDSPLGP
jgi:hypothetical protein